jgi:flagellar biosynthesis/type III secretory pathway chaperone
MESATFSLDEFEKTLNDMHENLEKFIQSLEQEKNLLEHHDAQKLHELIKGKQFYIDSIHQLSTQCQTLLNNAQFPFNEKSVLKVISQFPSHRQGDMSKKWQAIKHLLKVSDQKNLVNGIIIATLKNYNDALLNLHTNRPKESTYSKAAANYNPAVSTREHKV